MCLNTKKKREKKGVSTLSSFWRPIYIYLYITKHSFLERHALISPSSISRVVSTLTPFWSLVFVAFTEDETFYYIIFAFRKKRTNKVLPRQQKKWSFPEARHHRRTSISPRNLTSSRLREAAILLLPLLLSIIREATIPRSGRWEVSCHPRICA